MIRYFTFFVSILTFTTTYAQVDITYYLPANTTYSSEIPEPKDVIGHEVGEWHISHDRLVNYMYAVANASDRITIQQIGETFENRPLLNLIITSPDNHQNLEKIKTDHQKLSDPAQSGSVDIHNIPAVTYMGYSIHGNEPSGSNASLLAVYYLAAAQGDYIEKILKETVIILDPSFNPDGLNRFASYVNANKSYQNNVDPNNMELNEPWPRGRTNHYWFDLNRDWLVAQLPESQARIKVFQEWKPNLLTDHHEMGSNSSFFFQPGIPSRNNPLTPKNNYELTRKLGEYHAKALDEIGSMYYTHESYDDYYYGKGSTYPDVNGAVGILFEQASSRGHARETENGVLDFPFTIKNQFTTTLSSLKGLNELRTEFLQLQKDFYINALNEARSSANKAVVFASKDKYKNYHLAELIDRHKIEIYQAKNNTTVNGKSYSADETFIVPMEQPKHKLIRAIFDKTTTFQDSLFYDVSAWTLPLAFNVNYQTLSAKSYSSGQLGDRFSPTVKPKGNLIGEPSKYAYAFEWNGYYAPKMLNQLLKNGFKVKVASEEFNNVGRKFARGTILIPVEMQNKPTDMISEYLKTLAAENGVDVYALKTGLDYQGVSLGSPSFINVEKPNIILLVGDGASSYDAGEIWHLFDQRFDINVTLMPTDIFNRADLEKYNTLIMADGSYSSISTSGAEKLKTWVREGGSIVAAQNALKYLNKIGVGKFKFAKTDKLDSLKNKPYKDIDEFFGAQEIGGAIFETTIDLTNPLFYGYESNKLPVFRNSEDFLEKSTGGFSNPMIYTSSPLLSGYISEENLEKLRNTSGVGMNVYGGGRVIGFTDDLNFRAFWYGTNKVFLNAIFFGRELDRQSGR
uniref:M14 metallopeptidase family protein n=1 Tax=Fulvivirga sp. TaxID=1931237 RepID=UPI00404AF972